MQKITAEVLADSIGPHGIRLTTVELTFPRMALADLTRHRAFSYSIESSRARPIEAVIEQVRTEPYVPIFLARQKGMSGGAPLPGREQRRTQWKWIEAAHAAADAAESMLHTSKQHANRMLEPFMWTTGIITATDWENFLNLREHPAAMPELQAMARVVRQAGEISNPKNVGWGGWHLPLVTYMERALGSLDRPTPEGAIDGAYVSAGRCARTSFKQHAAPETMNVSMGRWNGKLAPYGHWSPGEHPARMVTEKEWNQMLDRQDEELARAHAHNESPDSEAIRQMLYVGNFQGWVQLRKHYEGERVFRG